MRKIVIALVLAGVVGTSGCGSVLGALNVLKGSVATQVPATTADAEKGLTVTHLALNAIAENILTATKNGTLHGPAAATVKAYYDQADDALKAADQLDVVANAQGVMDKVTSAQTLIGMITALVH